jgi:hypothetical protein
MERAMGIEPTSHALQAIEYTGFPSLVRVQLRPTSGRCSRPVGRFHFSFFAAEAVAGAVSLPVAVHSKIVTGLLNASFCECLRADPRRKVAPVNIVANHASIFWKAPSIAL